VSAAESVVDAARIYGVGDVRVESEPVAVAGPGEVMLRVTAVGLCGSDLHWYQEGAIGDARLSRPLVLGHEFAGVVVAVGACGISGGIFGTNYATRGAVDSVTNCSTTASFTVDTLPLENATRYDPMTYHYNYDSADHKLSASYELTYKVTNADENGFVSDYYDGSNTTDGKLNTSSALVKAIGYTVSDGSTHAGCLTLAPYETASNGAVSPTAAGAVQSNGDWQGSSGKDKYGNYPKVNTVKVGQGLTYIASAIYAAQAALTAEKARMAALGKVTHNAMIIQSDGGMNMQWIYFPHGLVTQNPPAANQPSSGKYIGNFKNYNLSSNFLKKHPIKILQE